MDQLFYSHPVFPTVNRDAQDMMALSMNALATSRSEFFRRLLDPRRDYYSECGYPGADTQIGADSYRILYDREAIAARVVEVLPKESWQVTPLVYEDEKPDKSTPFEEAWDNLGQKLRGEACWYQDEQGSPVWQILKRADILSGIGHFGVLLLGIDDEKRLDEPADGVISDTPDSFLSPQEEKSIRDPKGTPTFDPKSGEVTEKKPPTQNRLEQAVFNIWIKEREVILNSLARNAERLEGTDQQYVPYGVPAPQAGAMGTDQQYFGVVAGGLEYPSAKPSKKPRNLLFVRAYDESQVQIVRYEWNIRSPRFGLPVMYRITLNDPREAHTGIGLPTATVYVHWSRVIHLADFNNNANSSMIFAPPRMRPVLNNLLGLQKLYCGAPEMFWKSAMWGIVLKTHPQLGGDVKIDKRALQGTIENYQNGLQRIMALMGMDASVLQGSVQDPTQQVDKQIEALCIKLGCPIRVFKGSERGELASGQDDESWNDRLRERQNDYITPQIIVPFVDRLISMGVLPEPEGYSVEWPDLDSIDQATKATIANTKTTALAAYVSGNCESIVPPLDFLTQFMGMDEEQAQAMLDKAAEAHDNDETMTMPPQTAGMPKSPPEGTQAHDQKQQQADQLEAMKNGQVPGQAQPQGGAKGGPPLGKGGSPKAPAGPPQAAAEEEGDE